MRAVSVYLSSLLPSAFISVKRKKQKKHQGAILQSFQVARGGVGVETVAGGGVGGGSGVEFEGWSALWIKCVLP